MSAREAIAGLLLGESLVMQRLRALIERVAPTNLPVLIEGPTGSGKELVARAVHIASGRKGAFVPFNVCAIADTMFEDTLFGHVRGAFTGALQDSPGYLAQAHNGTAFFDEVSGLSLGAQAKLLRAIETREFRPVGSRRDVSSDFRLVAATNESLALLQDRSAFREDLRHRFGKVRLVVPPLASRPEDLVLLSEHFLRSMGTAARSFTKRAMDRLHDYEWTGNVRELRAVIEAAAVIASNERIDAEDLSLVLRSERHAAAAAVDLTLRETLDVLRSVQDDVLEAARVLGVNKTTVYRRLRRIGVGPEAGRSAAIHPRAPTSLLA